MPKPEKLTPAVTSAFKVSENNKVDSMFLFGEAIAGSEQLSQKEKVAYLQQVQHAELYFADNALKDKPNYQWLGRNSYASKGIALHLNQKVGYPSKEKLVAYIDALSEVVKDVKDKESSEMVKKILEKHDKNEPLNDDDFKPPATREAINKIIEARAELLKSMKEIPDHLKESFALAYQEFTNANQNTQKSKEQMMYQFIFSYVLPQFTAGAKFEGDIAEEGKLVNATVLMLQTGSIDFLKANLTSVMDEHLLEKANPKLPSVLNDDQAAIIQNYSDNAIFIEQNALKTLTAEYDKLRTQRNMLKKGESSEEVEQKLIAKSAEINVVRSFYKKYGHLPKEQFRTLEFAVRDHQYDLNKSIDDVISLGNFEDLKLCIELGADIRTMNKNGQTPLEVANQSGKYSDEQMKELVTLADAQGKIKIDLKDKDQFNMAKEYCAEYSRIMKYPALGEYFEYSEVLDKLDAMIAGNKEQPPKFTTEEIKNEMLRIKKEYFNSSTDYNLNISFDEKRIDFLKNIADKSINEIRGEFGKIENECIDYLNTTALKDYPALKIMLQEPYPLHQIILKDRIGESPVHKEAALNELLKSQKYINEKNPEGLTPLQIAAKKGDKKLVAKLLDAGADPKITTTNYKRSGFQAFTDGMKGLFTGKGFKHFTENPPLNAGQLAKLNGKTEISETLQNAKPPVKKVEPPKVQVELLDRLVKIDKPGSVVVDVNELTNSKSAVVQISGASAKAPKVETSPMVAIYMKEIVGILSELNVEHNGINPVDLPQGEDHSGYLRDLASKNELKVEIDALKEILVYLNANPTIDDSKPEEMAKLLEKASTVLGQAKIDKKIASKTSYDEEGKLSLKTQALLSTMKDQLSPKVPKSTAKMGQK